MPRDGHEQKCTVPIQAVSEPCTIKRIHRLTLKSSTSLALEMVSDM